MRRRACTPPASVMARFSGVLQDRRYLYESRLRRMRVWEGPWWLPRAQWREWRRHEGWKNADVPKTSHRSGSCGVWGAQRLAASKVQRQGVQHVTRAPTRQWTRKSTALRAQRMTSASAESSRGTTAHPAHTAASSSPPPSSPRFSTRLAPHGGPGTMLCPSNSSYRTTER